MPETDSQQVLMKLDRYRINQPNKELSRPSLVIHGTSCTLIASTLSELSQIL